MPNDKARYTRLSSQFTGLLSLFTAGRDSLWLADDHVLAVRNRGCSEQYKRFYFHDIQAIVACKTAAGAILNIFLAIPGAVLLLLLIQGAAMGWSAAGMIPLLLATALCLVPFAINSSRGPTCACYVRTAVQTERLSSPNRFRIATEVVGLLRPLIEDAQGGPVEIPLPSASEHPATPVAAQPLQAARPAGGLGEAAAPLVHYSGRAHEILFAVLLLDLLHSGLAFGATSPLMSVAGVILGLGLIVATIGAMTRQHNTDIPRGVKAVVWCTLGYVLLGHVFGSIYSTVFVMTNPEAAGSVWSQLEASSAVSPLESPARLFLLLFSIIGSGVLGFTGLFLLSRFRRAHAAGLEDSKPEVSGSQLETQSPELEIQTPEPGIRNPESETGESQ